MADQPKQRSAQQSQRKRPLEEFNKTRVGLVAIAMIAVLIAALVVASKIGIGQRTVNAQFLQAAALQPGNPVTVAGIEVGTVKSLKLAGDHVDAQLRVRNDVKLGKDTKAAIMVTTILGSRYLALEPDAEGALPNNTIDLAHTQVPYDLQQALHDATVTYEDLNTDNLAASLDALGQQLKTLPPVIPRAMDNLHKLSTIIGDRRDQLGSLLKTMDTVTTTLRRQQANVGVMVHQGEQLFGEFVQRRAAFRALMQGVTDLVDTLGDTIVNDRPQLEALLQNLSKLTDMLAQHDDLLRSTLQIAPVTVRGLANASGTGNAIDLNVGNGIVVDSWMCAISGRAKQFGMIPYFKDCK